MNADELMERLRDPREQEDHLYFEAADAIEAQAREIERLTRGWNTCIEVLFKAQGECDTLRAEVAAIRAQEPVAGMTQEMIDDICFELDGLSKPLERSDVIYSEDYPKAYEALLLAVKFFSSYEAKPAAPVPTQDVSALVEVMQEAADRLEGIKGGSVSDTIAMMRAALSSAQAAPARVVPEWQPIETAPKDGKSVLVLRTGDLWPGVAFLSGRNRWHWSTSGAWAGQPSYWMPLPAAPKQKGGAA